VHQSPARAAAILIVEGLRERGHRALLAGGCVRDELLGRVPSDYDVVTDATPQVIANAFPRTAEVGAHFGVMLVRIDLPSDSRASGEPLEKHIIEVATFRSDGSYTDKRRPDAVHFSSPDADAARRDFTVNALFLDPLAGPAELAGIAREHPNATCVLAGEGRGVVIDYVRGLADLQARLLRAVGDPEARLAEDHLRALRAVRLSAKLGFAIEAATAQAITRHAADLVGISKERIGDEFRLMMEHPSRREAMRTLARLGLLSQVLEGVALAGARSAEFDARLLGALPEDAIREGGVAGPASGVSAGGLGVCLAAILVELGLDVASFGSTETSEQRREPAIDATRAALCLSNLERDRLVCCLRVAGRLAGGWWEGTEAGAGGGVAARKRLMGGFGWADGMALLGAMDRERAAAIGAEAARLAADGVGIAPEPILTGDHLVAWGLRPGKVFKDLLDRVYDAQLEGQVRDLEQARELVARLRV
jgi:poly(A) polymerase